MQSLCRRLFLCHQLCRHVRQGLCLSSVQLRAEAPVFEPTAVQSVSVHGRYGFDQQPVQSRPGGTLPVYPSPLRRDVLSMLWAAVTSAWVASPVPSLAHAQAHGIVSRLRRASSTQRPEIAAAVLTYCAARTHAASPAVVAETWLECQRLVLDRWPPRPDETQWREPGGGTVV